MINTFFQDARMFSGSICAQRAAYKIVGYGTSAKCPSFRLRASADRLRSAARTALPAVVSPAPSDEPPHNDDHLREGDPEVDDSLPALSAPHQLLVSVMPGVRTFHHPTFRRLKRCRLALLRDHGEQATV